MEATVQIFPILIMQNPPYIEIILTNVRNSGTVVFEEHLIDDVQVMELLYYSTSKWEHQVKLRQHTRPLSDRERGEKS